MAARLWRSKADHMLHQSADQLLLCFLRQPPQACGQRKQLVAHLTYFGLEVLQLRSDTDRSSLRVPASRRFCQHNKSSLPVSS